jgi:phosphoenolpyruvate carboxykinase (ATP)
LNQAAFKTNPVFGFEVPTTCSGVPATILDPAATWTDQTAFEQDQRALAKFFIERAAKLGLPTEVMAQIPKV